MTEPLVWLPFDPGDVPGLPGSLRYERAVPAEWDGADPVSVAEVAFYVPPYEARPADVEVLARMPALEVVQTLTAGVDHVRPHLPEHVRLCTGRGIHDASTAELAMTLVLASLRGVPGFVRAQDAEVWAYGFRPALADRRVLLLGYGAVGQALEQRLAGFEVDVVRVARTARFGVHGLADLPRLLPEADVVVLTVPLTDETRGLVDAAFLARLRDGALLVNLARGAVVDTDALVAELCSGRISAAVDVTDPEPLPAGHPLWSCPNLLLSPHVGGASSAMAPRADRLLRKQLAHFAAGEPLRNEITGSY